MSLPVIYSGGISAYCSDLIINEKGEIYFLSVAGYQTAVKGIIANVLENGSVTIMIDDEYVYPSRSTLNYTVHYQRLPSGLYQGVVLLKIALPDNKEPKNIFLVLSEDSSLVKDLFFKHLENKTEVPLHPVWSHWLWDTFSENDWLTSLDTLIGNYQGYLVEIYEGELKEIITRAIADKNQEVIECFKKGETDGRCTLFEGLP
jgi:hypothetical protein